MKNGAIGRAGRVFRQYFVSRKGSGDCGSPLHSPTGALNFFPRRDILKLVIEREIEVRVVVEGLEWLRPLVVTML